MSWADDRSTVSGVSGFTVENKGKHTALLLRITVWRNVPSVGNQACSEARENKLDLFSASVKDRSEFRNIDNVHKALNDTEH